MFRMLTTLADVEAYYAKNEPERHKVLYEAFAQNITEKNPTVAKAFEVGEGFGELAFCWQWQILVDAMKPDFKFLEIGVYKGRTLGIVMRGRCNGAKPVTEAVDHVSDGRRAFCKPVKVWCEPCWRYQKCEC